MQFSALLGAAGGSEQSLDVSADVRLGPDPAGGFRISGITLTVRGSAAGLTADDFARIAQEAKSTCPVSKALTGTDISLEVNPRCQARPGHNPARLTSRGQRTAQPFGMKSEISQLPNGCAGWAARGGLPCCFTGRGRAGACRVVGLVMADRISG